MVVDRNDLHVHRAGVARDDGFGRVDQLVHAAVVGDAGQGEGDFDALVGGGDAALGELYAEGAAGWGALLGGVADPGDDDVAGGAVVDVHDLGGAAKGVAGGGGAADLGALALFEQVVFAGGEHQAGAAAAGGDFQVGAAAGGSYAVVGTCERATGVGEGNADGAVGAHAGGKAQGQRAADRAAHDAGVGLVDGAGAGDEAQGFLGGGGAVPDGDVGQEVGVPAGAGFELEEDVGLVDEVVAGGLQGEGGLALSGGDGGAGGELVVAGLGGGAGRGAEAEDHGGGGAAGAEGDGEHELVAFVDEAGFGGEVGGALDVQGGLEGLFYAVAVPNDELDGVVAAGEVGLGPAELVARADFFGAVDVPLQVTRAAVKVVLDGGFEVEGGAAVEGDDEVGVLVVGPVDGERGVQLASR